MLSQRLGEKNLKLRWRGGVELFDDVEQYDVCREKITYLNKMAKKHLGITKNYCDSPSDKNKFKNIVGAIKNRGEGEIDTASMMHTLLLMARKMDIQILNGIHVEQLHDNGNKVEIETNAGTFKSSKLIVAVNGFASELLNIKDVLPARAQVLITKKIPSLSIKGCYHLDRGFYYFRELDGRILLGGGRNLDMQTETTTSFDLNKKIHRKLDEMLKTMILPGKKFEVEHRWAGIMGVGSEKKPIVRHHSKNIVAAVRMGGMGIAIGALVGHEASLLC